MADKNSELLERLLATFRIEADEYVQAMSNGLLELEKLPAGDQQQQIIESIFRQAHSLKGAARAVKFSQIEAICQPFESLFAALRDEKLSLSTPLIDLLHRTVSLVESLANSTLEQARERQPEINTVVRQLDRALGRAQRTARTGRNAPPPTAAEQTQQPPPAAPTRPKPQTGQMPASPAKTVRVSVNKLNSVMRLSEELLISRLAASQRATDIQQAAAELASWRKQSADMQALLRPLERTLATSSDGSEELHKLITYLADEQVRVRMLEHRLAELSRSADNDRRDLTAMTDDLQQRVRDMQLLPCATLLELFARQARELAREQGKEVNVDTLGSDIEVDRRLLDEIKDPLIHLVRNCVDHGIELPAERRKANKPSEGNISISVNQKDSGKITITIKDDGAGVDSDRLKSVAIERGMLKAEAANRLSEADTLELMFKSGLSTSPILTDVSGRGLGMAIVRDKIEQLSGTIEASSKLNGGTSFQLILPVTLATFRGTLIRLADRIFIIPSANIERAVRFATASVHHLNNSNTVGIDGQALALYWLHDILGLPRQPPDDESNSLAVILGRGPTRVALRVDEVIGEQEVLVKGLGPQLRRVKYVTGASVLGSGEVVPVLNVPDLLESAGREPVAAPTGTTAAGAPVAQQSILVAEDSITSRSLMKNILEAAGYKVVTAVDGIDAYTTLRTHDFDLVVSDVDMPRMSGFDLTAKIRADQQLSEIPVILVTTLDSREDREKGVDAGANAYIVKSSFDQSNLLEVIQRLI